MSLILLGILNSQVSGLKTNYWIFGLGPTTKVTKSSIADSDGNVFSIGHTTSNVIGTRDILLIKTDNFGDIQWVRQIGKASAFAEGWDIAFDSTGNIMITAESYFAGLGARDTYTAKLNSSGITQWQKSISNSQNTWRSSIGLDSSDNSYVVTDWDSDTGGGIIYKPLVVKYNSSGVLQWQKYYDVSSQIIAMQGKTQAVDSSGNVYFSAAGSSDNYLVKLNSSGAIQWQVQASTNGVSTFNPDNSSVALMSNGNVIRTMRVYDTNIVGSGIVTQVFNSSGTLQYSRRVSVTSKNVVPTGVAVDSDDNFYVIADTNALTSSDVFIIKYNSAGTVQWQRLLGNAGTNNSMGISVSPSNDLVIAVRNFASLGQTVVLPSDGSLTGVYSFNGSDFTYQTASFTLDGGSLPLSTPSGTMESGTLTDTTPTTTNQELTTYTPAIAYLGA